MSFWDSVRGVRLADSLNKYLPYLKYLKVIAEDIEKKKNNNLVDVDEVVKVLTDLGGVGATEEWVKGWDEAINTAINEVLELPRKG